MNSGTHRRGTKQTALMFITALLVASLISGCTFNLSSLFSAKATPPPPQITTSQELPMAKVTFVVEIPADAPAGAVELEMLDEVTGLALNPQRYGMIEIAPLTYSVEIPIPIGAVVKYRYIRQGTPLAVEFTASGNMVRYRMDIIQGPSIVQDKVYAWTDFRYSGPTGQIKGQVIAAGTNSPIPGAMIVTGGATSVTASDGSFLLEGIPPGTHNLVAYSMDGSFVPFQQGALVAENSTTPAAIQVNLLETVKVTFIAQIPSSNIRGLPVRLVGNISQLGNTFADLGGGLSIIASRAPLMTVVSEGIYSLTLDLPVGLDLRYKYTLGDGFWNAEHVTDGQFRVRQLIVPDSDLTVTDIIDTWRAGDSAPITFTVQAPENTPKEDIVSIQFNPFGWTPPIPMWPLGENRWVYVLYSPLYIVENIGYRYCRNDQCGSADDFATRGAASAGLPFTTSPIDQNFQDDVQQWAWWDTSLGPTTIVAPEIEPRGNEFMAGIEFSQHYSPTWEPYKLWAYQNSRQLGANWIILSPSWHYTRLVPPVFEPVAGVDPLWGDILKDVQTAQANGFQLGLFPRLSEPEPGIIWQEPINDLGWWLKWMDRYRIFILNYADLAQQTNVPMLIIGGKDVLPAIPGGKAINGEPSGVPEDAFAFWNGLIQELRGRYSGQIAWALPYPQATDSLPEFISGVDLIYVLYSAQLSTSTNPVEGELQSAFGNQLDADIFPIYENTGKPVLIAVDYPSVDGAASACVQMNSACIDFDRFSQPLAEVQEIPLDLAEQASIYGAALNAIHERTWISGFISRGYYPPAALQDKSSSIHGKPAADILWYWFPRLTGQ